MKMKEFRLGDITTIYNGATPSTKNSEYWDGDIVWITPKDLSDQNRKYIDRGERTITEEGLSKISSELLPKGTLLLSSRAPIGLLSIANTELVTNQGFKNIVTDSSVLLNEYLYYYLKINVEYLNKLGTGTTFKELSKTTLENIKIRIPSVSVQKTVANTLSALDSKIELNNQINQQLEEMTKTIYDYWFVQFDFPNEEGKPYKSSGGKMVYNKQLRREIPEGWEVNKLEEIEKNIITGKTPSTKREEYYNGEIPFVTINDIRQDLFIHSAERTLTQAGADSQKNKYLNKGDIAVSCIGTIGMIGIIGRTAQTNQQINTISQIDYKNRYYLLNSLRNYFHFNEMAAKKGAVLSNMNKREFSSILLIDPSDPVKQSYADVVESIYGKIENNILQNQQLASLRVWLLPMLMNGQVTVGD